MATRITYSRFAGLPTLCISSSEDASGPRPLFEASHTVHLPHRIDVRPSVTALVCGHWDFVSDPSLWNVSCRERVYRVDCRDRLGESSFCSEQECSGSRGIYQAVEGDRGSKMEMDSED